MRYLGLDIGTRRTGVAYADDATGIPLPLETISHDSFDDLMIALDELITKRKIDYIVVGLPRLLSGEEGSQAQLVRGFSERMKSKWNLPLTLIDERYSTPSRGDSEMTRNRKSFDPDSTAATALLGVFLKG